MVNKPITWDKEKREHQKENNGCRRIQRPYRNTSIDLNPDLWKRIQDAPDEPTRETHWE